MLWRAESIAHSSHFSEGARLTEKKKKSNQNDEINKCSVFFNSAGESCHMPLRSKMFLGLQVTSMIKATSLQQTKLPRSYDFVLKARFRLQDTGSLSPLFTLTLESALKNINIQTYLIIS